MENGIKLENGHHIWHVIGQVPTSFGVEITGSSTVALTVEPEPLELVFLFAGTLTTAMFVGACGTGISLQVQLHNWHSNDRYPGTGLALVQVNSC